MGDFRGRVRVEHHSRVRCLERDRSDRAHEAGDRAKTGRLDRAIHAVGDGLAVVNKGSVEEDDLAARLVAAPMKYLLTPHNKHRRRDAYRGSASAPTQP